MMDDIVDEVDVSEMSWKDEILGDFRAWLESVPDEMPAEDAEEAEEQDGGDLLRLVGEMTALRQEVRLMGRSTGKLLKTVEDVSGDVKTNVVPLVEEIRRLDRSARVSETRSALGPVLLAYGDLRESLCEVMLQGSGVTRHWSIRRRLWEGLGIERQQDALKTLIRQIDSVLERHAVKPIAAEGQAFDSYCMTADGVSREGRVEPGHVSGIVKQGYSLAGNVLRAAVVIVEEEKTNDHRD